MNSCSHLDAAAGRAAEPLGDSCKECDDLGHPWVHLRACVTCGNVGCCDSGPGRHATAHHRATGHPVMRSIQPGESWRWCYVDQLMGY